MEILRNEKLSRYTTIHLGGRAKKICFPENINELKNTLLTISDSKFMIIGNGSNIAFRDGGYDGVIISLRKFHRDTININNKKINVGAGVSCSKFAKFLHKEKISGFEFLHGIPGTIGGAMAMNAGAFSESIWDKICTFKVIGNDGVIQSFNRKQISTLYRKVHINRKSHFVEAEFSVDSKIKFNKNMEKIKITSFDI